MMNIDGSCVLSLLLACAARPSSVSANTFGFCTELAEKNAALSSFLRSVSGMKPCSDSSNSRRSEINNSVGTFVSSAPIDSKL